MALTIPTLVYAEENTETVALPTIKVEAESQQPAITEGTQSYTTKSTSTATKLNLSLRETPQSVKVLTREYLDDRNIDSFQDLMNTITGVSTSRTDERQSVYARGFQLRSMKMAHCVDVCLSNIQMKSPLWMIMKKNVMYFTVRLIMT